MKIPLIIRNALKRQGVKPEQIEAALASTKPVTLKLSRAMVKRIAEMVSAEGVAVVTRKQVSSWKGYQVRKNNTSHLSASLIKTRAAKAAKKKPKTPAEISASLS